MARTFDEKEITPSLNEALETVKSKIAAADPVFDISSCPTTMYLKEKAETGRRSCTSQLTKMAKWIGYEDPEDRDIHLRVPWHKLNVDDVQWLRLSYLERGYSPATVALAVSTLKGVIKQSWAVGWIEDNQWIRVRDLVGSGGKNKVLTGRELSEKEIRKLISVCSDGTTWGVRDMAILSLLSGTGMRRATLASIKIKHFRDDDTVIVTKVKGGLEHEHPLPQGCQMALNAWFKVRGRSGDYLFNPVAKNGDINSKKGLSGQGIYRLLQKRIRLAGIADATPHDFRRSFITDLIRKYGLSIAQDFAGHASPETTKRYDRSKFEERIKIAQKIEVPFIKS